jgi:hypothetical protein
MADAPLFIIGTERSGSNLLRLILDRHPRITIPHPPHVMRYFAPLEPRYGDLAEPARFRALVEDVLALVRSHIHPWPWIPDAEDLVRRARGRSVFAVYVALHEAWRDHVGKARWGCKSTFMIDHAERVLGELPGARLLWLVRDPRDVSSSSSESVFSTFHPANTARLWKDAQDEGLRLMDAGRPILLVHYEALVREPESEVRRICAWIGEEFDPAMLTWFEGEEARRSATLSESWQNTARPMRKERIGRWRKDLAPADARLIEVLAGETMGRLGYVPEGSGPIDTGRLARLGWWAEEELGWLRVEARSIRRDRYRSEERRVGKECRRLCRSRWSPYH